MAPVNGLSKELAPLEVLQSSQLQHRRGSITDPSLHTASSYNSLKSIMNHPLHHDTRPSAGYVFGNATPRSPPTASIDPLKSYSAHAREESFPELDEHVEPLSRSQTLADPGSRRPSLAPSVSGVFSGTKRKMSSELCGHDDSYGDSPFSSPRFNHDELPPIKRRGSIVDTQKMGLLSLDDRRPSVDSRLPGSWWSNGERRDSTSSVLSYTSSPGSVNWTPPSGETSRQLDSSDRVVLNRRMSAPDTAPNMSGSSSRTSRNRSRPPSRGSDESNPAKLALKDAASPYSRSPELRVSHKLAERKRRAEMKDLFEDLKDQLPAEKGMKASKWEILSKSVDLVIQLKATNSIQAQEIENLKRELAHARGHTIHGDHSTNRSPHSSHAQPQHRPLHSMERLPSAEHILHSTREEDMDL
ncbi:hypothetical protein DL96DRAFT_1679167 [Flagelloscypha sp. PMI_526]|nr:hypothetical protein DL96DRAFT_1679167 [Flagelloscypha sp. PMI_526]